MKKKKTPCCNSVESQSFQQWPLTPKLAQAWFRRKSASMLSHQIIFWSRFFLDASHAVASRNGSYFVYELIALSDVSMNIQRRD